MKITKRALCSLIREVLLEVEVWEPGKRTRAGALGRVADAKERLMHLYMQLRQAYIDVEDALGGPDEAAARQTLEMLQAVIARAEEEHARAEEELSTR